MIDYTYEEAVQYINDIPKFASKNTIEDTQDILTKIYPLDGPKIIHVAGTNGKGSVCAYLDSVMRHAGLKVGLFTSPHLVLMNERIKVSGQDISNQDFVRSFMNVMEVIKKEGANHPSFFEYLFLMAMDYFGKQDLDYIILETGLGGRKDATNSVLKKTLSVITKIGLDHTEYLGDTISLIAAEKAGIIKNEIPVVFWDGEDESATVFRQIAEAENSTCYSAKKSDIFVNSHTGQGIDFSIGCEYYRYDRLSIGMVGKYQVENAALAVLALYVLNDSRIKESDLENGLKEAFWPGRMEQLSPQIYIDGAHNVDGIKAFVDAVRSIPANEGDTRSLLFSVVSDKEYEEMVRLLCLSGLFKKVYLCRLDSKRGLELESIQKLFSKYSDMPVDLAKSAKEAYEAAVYNLRSDEKLFIAGSLYLVGEIKGLVE